MPRENQKLKMLYLAQIFFQETDEDKGLSMPQIIERLYERGISAERKAVYRDIEALREFGMDIEKYQRAPVEYGLAKRKFSQAELTLMIDAVQSSRFLTERKSNELVNSIKTLARRDLAERMSKDLHVDGRIKSQNESVFNNLDIIQEAISRRRQIEFRYFRYDADKRKRWACDEEQNAREYVRTPVKLVYSDNCYYLVAYSSSHQGFGHFRVDRMGSVRLSEEAATRNKDIAEFDIEKYASRLFGMYTGETLSASLLVDESIMNAVIDRFGREAESVRVDETHARVFVTVMKSPVFYGWLAQFGTHIRIEKPAALQEAYRDYLREILGSYEIDA